jgi:hypothetical protein
MCSFFPKIGIKEFIMKRLFNIIFLSFFLISQPAFSEIVPKEIVFHPADAEIAYS